jgi:hypothetical protein
VGRCAPPPGAEGASSDFFTTRFALLDATGQPTTATVRFQWREARYVLSRSRRRCRALDPGGLPCEGERREVAAETDDGALAGGELDGVPPADRQDQRRAD